MSDIFIEQASVHLKDVYLGGDIELGPDLLSRQVEVRIAPQHLRVDDVKIVLPDGKRTVVLNCFEILEIRGRLLPVERDRVMVLYHTEEIDKPILVGGKEGS